MSAKKKSKALDIGELMDAGLKAAQTEFGEEKCYVASQHHAHQRVVPIPHLSLRYLTQASGWPISRFTQSGGQYGTGKSCFIFQLETWYLLNGGFVIHIDTENKTSQSLMQSFLPDMFQDPERPDLQKRMQYQSAGTINEWQRMLCQYIELLDGMSALPNYPGLLAVDSMMGADCEENLKKLHAEGEAAGRTFSESPLLISNFFRSYPGLMVGKPITLHVSHHEKPDLATGGMRRAGGKASDFYATLDIQFKRRSMATSLGKSESYEPTSYRDYYARTVNLKTRKNSMGTDGRDITVLLKWRISEDEATGDVRQKTWWDWDSCTAEVLAGHTKLLEDRGIMDVKSVTKHGRGNYMWSDALGISEAEAMPAHEFGAFVESHDIMRKLDIVFGVQQYTPLSAPENLE